MANQASKPRSTVDRDDRRYWCAVASREHVKLGLKQGFAQVCHGRKQPLARLKPQDGIVYYSPTERFGEGGKCQKFTSIGLVKDQRIYSFEMAPGFVPFRRDIEYFETKDASIRPLLPHLTFTRGRTNWGYIFRFGLFEITRDDFILIFATMSMESCAEKYGKRDCEMALARIQGSSTGEACQ